MLPKTTTIEVQGEVAAVKVVYLMTETEGKSEIRDKRGPIASGMEYKWLKRAKCDAAGRNRDDTAAMGRVREWSEIADIQWPKACADVVAGLSQLDAFCVIPSSRDDRRVPLVRALRARFPSAIELTYKRPPERRFGDAGEDAIFQALSRTDHATLPIGACVAVADDWAGGGTTLRATIRRIRADHGDCIGSFVCAVPGVSAVPLTLARSRSRRTSGRFRATSRSRPSRSRPSRSLVVMCMLGTTSGEERLLRWRGGDHSPACDLRTRLVLPLRDAAHSPDARGGLSFNN